MYNAVLRACRVKWGTSSATRHLTGQQQWRQVNCRNKKDARCAHGASRFPSTPLLLHAPPHPTPRHEQLCPQKYGPNGSVRWTHRLVRATILPNGGNTSLGTRHPAHSKHKAMEASNQHFSE